ncbi:MAG: protease pro-enzyme activation domain-containing protein [Gemmataceae bacterium]
MSSRDLTEVPGSNAGNVAGATKVAEVDPQTEVEVTVRVRPQAPPPSDKEVFQLNTQPLEQRKFLSRDEFASAYGADPVDMQSVSDFARANGLVVQATDPANRTLLLSGTAENMAMAFHVDFGEYEVRGERYRGIAGPAQLPSSLSEIVESVVGFANRPYARRPGSADPSSAD